MAGSKGKFEMYCKIKRNHNFEPYLNRIQNNDLHRNVTALRCASNILPINILRKQNINREKRFCDCCKNKELGTELHVLMLCSNTELEKESEKLLILLYKCSPQLMYLNKEQLLIYLAQAIEENITLHFSFFLRKIFKIVKQNKKDM